MLSVSNKPIIEANQTISETSMTNIRLSLSETQEEESVNIEDPIATASESNFFEILQCAYK